MGLAALVQTTARCNASATEEAPQDRRHFTPACNNALLARRIRSSGRQTECSLGGTPMVRLPQWLTLLLVLGFLVGLATPALAEEIKCKIQRLAPDKDQLVCTDTTGKTMTFQMDTNAKIRVNDRDVRLNE